MSLADMAAIGLVPGKIAPVPPEPNMLIVGVRTRYARMPPATVTDAILGPMM